MKKIIAVVNFPVFFLYDPTTGNSSETETLYMAHMDRQTIGVSYICIF